MWEKTYYNNTIGEWFIAFAIIILSYMIGRTLYWLIARYIKKITSATKTKIDDLFVDMVEEPLVGVVTISGIYTALNTLNLSDKIELWIARGFKSLLIFAFAWLATRLFDSVVKEYLMPMVSKSKSDLDDQLLPIIRKGVTLTIWGIAIVVALDNAGYDVGAVLAGLGIGGLAFALAAKDTISNLFGGVTIFTDRPFTIRDRIKVNEFDGTVNEIGIRSTRLVTLEGRTVTIPNSSFSNNPIENISSEKGRKVKLNLGLTYDTSPEKMEQALQILKDICQANPDINDDYSASFTEYGDSALNILLIYWIKKNSSILGTKSALNMAILKQFNAQQLEFAFPTQMIYKKEL
ncbi:MAG: mechanosensitive ion channel family protein [Candidatus Omnitrophica bacterium]|nr:mechanosensitive ion channel family protein [Candidatus Omnitrophota bacterium]